MADDPAALRGRRVRRRLRHREGAARLRRDLRDARPAGARAARPPTIRISDAAAAELRELAASAGRPRAPPRDRRAPPGGPLLRSRGGRRDRASTANGVALALDPITRLARRRRRRSTCAPTAGGPAFQVDVPGRRRACGSSRPTRGEGAARRRREVPCSSTCARPRSARRRRIPGARLLDDALRASSRGCDRDTPLVFHCHHGGRSQRGGRALPGARLPQRGQPGRRDRRLVAAKSTRRCRATSGRGPSMALRILSSPPPEPEEVAARLRARDRGGAAGRAGRGRGRAARATSRSRWCRRRSPGSSRVKQQQLVYGAIAPLMRGDDAPVHAIDRMVTRTP